MTAGLGRLGPLAWAIALAPAGALVVLLADRTHPVVPIALAGAAAAGTLVLLRPMLALVLAVALVPLEIFSIPLGGIGLSPAELMFALTGYGWAVKRLADGKRPWSDSPLSGSLLLLWLAALPGLALAEEPGAVLRFVLIWGGFLLVYQVIVNEADQDSLRTLLFAVALAAAAIGVVAAAGVSGQEQEVAALGDTATGRAEGALGDPNVLAAFLAMALPAGLLLAFDGRWGRPFAIGAVGVIFAALGLTLSRGGIFGSAGAILVMMGWRPLRRVATAAALALVGLTVFSANPLGEVQQVQRVLDRVESVKYQSASQTDQRPLIYRQTPKLIADHWLTGVGALNYSNVSPRYGIIDPATGDTFDHGHNVALTIGAELGIAGLIALGWLIVVVIRLVPKALARRPIGQRGLGFAVVGALGAIGLQSVIDTTVRSNVIAALVFVYLGALVVVSRLPIPPAQAALAGGGRPVTAAAIA